MIEKLNSKYYVRDEDDYTDKEVVEKINEIIDYLNQFTELTKGKAVYVLPIDENKPIKVCFDEIKS